jgi:hypothetical protein
MTAAPDPRKSHRHRLVSAAESHAAVHGSGALGRFNQRLALRITSSVGTMWAAYAFAALALISLPAAVASRSPIVIVAWVAQTFLQLVLLPIIIVGQNVQATASDARAEADHQTLWALHSLTAEIHTLSEGHTEILRRLEARR